ncbi:MAG: cupredoxin domain-containing protein [Candidatus Sifarchaeia archaeon]|jgi:cytochrome c oxidase subunit 2
MGSRIHKGWSIMASVVLMVLSFSLTKAGEMKTFEVRAKKYEFNPGTISVNNGDKVIIKAIANDRDHGIGIKQFNVNSLLPKGKWVTIEFVADKKGEFSIFCSKFCGWKHFNMKSKLIVE